MMWALAIKNKLTAALLLFAVIAVVVLTNVGTRSNNNKISSAVASIYEDRLLVESYIFYYAQALREIEEASEDAGLTFAEQRAVIGKRVDDIKKFNALYSKTQLTKAESANFARFTSLCKAIALQSEIGNTTKVKILAREAGTILPVLSSIQISEAKLQMDNVAKTNSFTDVLSQLELVVLIIVTVLIQILVFSSRIATKTKLPENINWN